MINIKFNFKDKYFILGLYFLILQILVIYRNYLLDDFILIFYYCNHVVFLFSIGFFLRKFDFIKALISVGFLLQFVYVLDFFSKVLFDIYITESTAYLFEYSTFTFIITLIVHLFSGFLALFFVFKEKISFKSLNYIFIYVCALYFLTLFLTPESYDINCVFNACEIEFLSFEYFTEFWIFFALVASIPIYYLQVFLYKLVKNIK